MLTTFAAVVALGLSLASTNAGTQMDTKMTAAAPAPEFSWTGFYIGGNAGVNFNEFDLSRVEGDVTLDGKGTIVFDVAKRGDNGRDELEFIGGGQLGYNYQWNRWVFGIEGDFQGVGDVDREFTRHTPIFEGSFENFRKVETDWFASVRPRIGYTFGRIMLYGTGGVAFADTTLTGRDRLIGFGGLLDSSAEDENVMVGWTAGGGIEFALTNWLTAGIEYRHSEFGDDNFDAGSSAQTGLQGITFASRTNSQDVNLVNDQVEVKVNVLFMNFFRR